MPCRRGCYYEPECPLCLVRTAAAILRLRIRRLTLNTYSPKPTTARQRIPAKPPSTAGRDFFHR